MGRTAEKRETPEQRWEEPRVLAGYGQIEGLTPGMTGVVDPDDLAEGRRREHKLASQAPRQNDGGVAVGRQQNDDRTASDPHWIRKATA